MKRRLRPSDELVGNQNRNNKISMADNLSVIKSRLSYNSKHSKVTFSVLSLGSSFMNEQERHKYEQLK